MVSRHQLRQAIEIIEKANAEGFKEITDELQNTIKKLKVELDNTDKQWQLLNNNMGKSQYVLGFDEKFFSNLKPTHSFTVKNFIHDWMQKQSDWRYPMCFLSPSTPVYTEHCLKSSLVYICTNNFTHQLLTQHIIKTLDKSTPPSQFRVKPLFHEGTIKDEHVPYNQIGNVISIDYFPYLSIEQIKNYFKSFLKILRPGGSVLVHITDADCDQEWKSVVGKKVTYCTIKIVQDLCNLIGLNYENCYHIDDMYTFFHLSKPGTLESIKKTSTKIEKFIDFSSK